MDNQQLKTDLTEARQIVYRAYLHGMTLPADYQRATAAIDHVLAQLSPQPVQDPERPAEAPDRKPPRRTPATRQPTIFE
ncbi:hypothetical protein [Arsenicibacter rosenii]|uniref:Uncharacterized protein n=1 Tax=Arsenicibacter rosenii TaxID=1750698 RepID=A0A1S2VAI9_9BACT|nr:hypothetical protein [Arsenicibacter rosenii]OIN55747.1 hypothetical protein BLX24_28440 [Arsenicibacter rosenii]